MLRVFLTIVLPLALPSILYFCWVGLVQPTRTPAPGTPAEHAGIPLVWLVGSGVLLLAIVLAVVTVHVGTTQPGTYVPPRWENGRVVPGHIDPSRIQPGARP